jgi:hypothetical protein
MTYLSNKEFDFPSFHQVKSIISKSESLQDEWIDLVKAEYLKKNHALNNSEMERLSFSFLSQVCDRRVQLFQIIDEVVSHHRTDIKRLELSSQAPFSFYFVFLCLTALISTYIVTSEPEVTQYNGSILRDRLEEIRINHDKYQNF